MVQASIMAGDRVTYLSRPLDMSMSHFFLLILFSNSFINPIVYAVRFRPFQVAFRIIFGLMKEEDRAAAIESVTNG